MQPTSMAVTIPLCEKQHRLARQFSRHQSNPKKADQVYLNTLAVFAVDFYLRCVGFETDWQASLSWDPVAQTLLGVADLELVGLGALECHPIVSAPSETQVVQIPPEAWSERIGYLVVQFDSSLRRATLLGFSETILTTGELRISSLRPLAELIEYLHKLSQPEPMFRSLEELRSHLRQTNQPKPIKMRTNLSLWFQNVFESDWRSIEELSKTDEESLAFSPRSANHLNTASIKRAKLINLGLELKDKAVALVVMVFKEVEREKVDIRVQLHPASGEKYLPPNIKMVLLSAGEIFDNAESRSWGLDNFIQLSLEGLPSECFEIQVTLGEVNVTEKFVI